MAQPLQSTPLSITQIQIEKRESEELLNAVKERSRRISEIHDNITKDEVTRTLLIESDWEVISGNELNKQVNVKNDKRRPWFSKIFIRYQTNDVGTEREKNFPDANFVGTEFCTNDDVVRKIAQDLIFSSGIRRFYVYKRVSKKILWWDAIFIAENDCSHKLKALQINVDSLLPTTHMLIERIRGAIGFLGENQDSNDDIIKIEDIQIPKQWLDLYQSSPHEPFSDSPNLKELVITLADHLDLI